MDKDITRTKMIKLVSAYHASGQTQSSFAKSHGIGKRQLNYWIKKLEASKTKSPSAAAFAPVAVKVPDTATCPSILIRFNGVEIEIPMVCLP